MAMESHSNFTYKSQHCWLQAAPATVKPVAMSWKPSWASGRCERLEMCHGSGHPSIEYCENQLDLDMIRYIYIHNYRYKYDETTVVKSGVPQF